jgi:hypothetical protein
MAIIGSIIIRLGADMKGFQKGLDSATARISRFANSTTAMFSGMIAGAGVGSAIMKGVSAASELNETLSKTGIIFGKSADTIIAQSETMAEKFGVSKNEYINAATSFGAVFKGLGRGPAEAAAMGNQLTLLGMDMASFDNAANSEVFTALQASLRGEFDPLERFRVFLSAAKIEAKALAMGLAATKGELDDNAKKTATLALIYEQTADAQGDLARTAESPANQFRKLAGEVQNLSIQLGQIFMPVALRVTEVLSDKAGGIGFALKNLNTIFKMGQIYAEQYISNFMIGMDTLHSNLEIFAKWVGSTFLNAIRDSFNGLTTIVTNFGKSILSGKLTDPLEGLTMTAIQMPKLAAPLFVDLSDKIAKVGEEAFAAANKTAAAATAITRGPAGAAGKSIWDQGAFEKDMGESAVTVAKKVEDRAPAGSVFGSADAAEAIARHRNRGIGDDKPMKELAKNGRDQLGVQNRIAASLEQINSKISAGSLTAYEIA